MLIENLIWFYEKLTLMWYKSILCIFRYIKKNFFGKFLKFGYLTKYNSVENTISRIIWKYFDHKAISKFFRKIMFINWPLLLQIMIYSYIYSIFIYFRPLSRYCFKRVKFFFGEMFTWISRFPYLLSENNRLGDHRTIMKLMKEIKCISIETWQPLKID